jgi:hypothetical protein
MSPEPQQTDPTAKASQTLEGKLTIIVTVVGAVLAGLATTFVALQEALPDAGWIAVAITIVGILSTMAATVMKLIGGRSSVKVSLNNVEAARLVAPQLPALTTKPTIVAADTAPASTPRP